MRPKKIRQIIRKFLHLIDSGVGTNEENQICLGKLLDQLAFALVGLEVDVDTREYPDPPRRSNAEVRQLAVKRFPTFGYYNVPEKVTSVAETGCIVGDAIDDVGDIYRDLAQVEWLWGNASKKDALWYLRHSYDSHWESHLRGLQGYLLALREEKE